MRKLIAFMFIALPLSSFAKTDEIKSNHANMIQAACASLMRDVQQQYGKSFFCKTTNEIAAGSNAAFLVENLNPNAVGNLIRFSNVYYEDPNNTLSTLHYDYDQGDLDLAIAYIQAGGGLTSRQQAHMACRNALAQMKQNADETNRQYRDKKISGSEYEATHSVQLDAMSAIEKQCPEGIVLG